MSASRAGESSRALISLQDENENAVTEEQRAQEELRIFKELELKNIFNKLPPEIRVIIWRLLLLRDATISTGWVSYAHISERKIGKTWHQSETERRWYKYQWGERRQQPSDSGYGYEPTYLGLDSVDLNITIATNPTPDQAKLIARGDTSPPCTVCKEICTQIACDVVLRGEPGSGYQFPEVINRMAVSVEPLRGLALLRVCKKAHEECSAILYGENIFVFNTSFEPFRGTILVEEDLEHYRNRIPGIPTRDGRPRPESRLRQNIVDMFVPGGFRPKFVAKAPMLSWFNKVGPKHTGMLTKVGIRGELGPDAGGPTFGTILQIYANILKVTCPCLKELVLLAQDMKYVAPVESDYVQRADELVGNAINTLTSLECLRLDIDPRHIPNGTELPPFEDGWGKAVRWVKLVRDRERQMMATAAGADLSDVAEAVSRVEIAAEPYQRGGRQGQRGTGRGGGRGRGGHRGQRGARGQGGRGS